jgi:nitrogen fixation-related uncharacterized protein
MAWKSLKVFVYILIAVAIVVTAGIMIFAFWAASS